MFHSAAVKLTVWYLGLIMLLSVACSWALYSVSSTDLRRNANRQISFFGGLLGADNASDFANLRQNQLTEDLRHLKANLLFFNALVLVGGGAASYGLARRTLKPIEQTLEAQTRFTADASHELRTPLTALQTENEVALRSPQLTKTEAVGQLRSNLEEVGKLKALVDGLLALANTTPEDTRTTVSLGEVIQMARARIDKIAKQKLIRLEISEPSKDISVKGNKQNLIDLLAILLDNAIKYSPSRSEVRIDLRQHNKNAEIIVSDSGRGIKKGDLPHIFDRFYRADDSRNKERVEGYGLGLAIAKKIVDRHNGAIEVRSAPSKGATFTLSLPL